MNKWFCLLILWVSSIPLAAAEWQKFDPFPYVANHYTEDSKLPHQSFLKGLQDKYGFLYFSTWGQGFYRYNGHIWTQFTRENSGLNDNTIVDMIYDGEDTIYIAHMTGGVSVFNIHTGKSAALVDPSFFEHKLSRITMDKEKNLYICSLKGLWIYTRETGQFEYFLCTALNDNWQWQIIYSTLWDSKGRLWLGTRFGVMIFDRDVKKMRYLPYKPHRESDSLLMKMIPGGRILVFCKNFIGMVDEEQGVVARSPYPALNEFAEKYQLPDQGAFTIDSRGNFFLSSRSKGVLMYNPRTGKTRNLSIANQQLINNYVNSSFTDRENTVWILTAYGVTKLNLSLFASVFSLNNTGLFASDASEELHFVFKDSRGDSWLYFHKDKFIAEIYKDRYKIIDVSPLMDKWNYVSHIFRHENRMIIRLASEHLGSKFYIYDRESEKFSSTARINHSLNSIVKNNKKYRFYSLLTGRLGIEEKDTVTGEIKRIRLRFWKPGILPIDVTIHFLDRSKQQILLLHDGYDGDSSYLYHMNSGEWTSGFFKNELKRIINEPVGIKKIVPDRRGGFWIHLFSPRGMILHYTDGVFTDYTPRLETKDLSIEDIQVDGKGRLLIAIPGSSIKILEGDSLSSYSRSDGLLFDRLTGGFAVNREGTIMVQSPDGIAILNETVSRAPSFDLNFYQGVNIKDKSVRYLFDGDKKSFVFPPAWRNITFYASANSYLDEKGLQYQFFLEGYHREWEPLSGRSDIQFAQLNPGRYTIKVRAVDRRQGRAEKEISFTIEPYWYETVIFRMGVLIVLILFLLFSFKLGVRFYTRSLKKKSDLLEEKVKKRTLQLKESQARLVSTAHLAGKAVVASEVLHNAGNVLNSINISTNTALQTIRGFDIQKLQKANDLLARTLNGRENDFENKEKMKNLLEYYQKIQERLNISQQNVASQLDKAGKSLSFMEFIIRSQEEHIHIKQEVQEVNIAAVIEETADFIGERIKMKNIEFSVNNNAADKKAVVPGQKSNFIPIFLNLYNSAIESLQECPKGNRKIHTEIVKRESRLIICISHTGRGYLSEEIGKVFQYNVGGEVDPVSYRLHSCANFVHTTGGVIKVESPGPGKGSTFIIEWEI